MARAMNDSGIEWIGEIPEYWTISRYKAICKIESGYPFDSSLFSNFEGFPIIRIRDITSGIIETYYQGEFSENYVVTKGDLLVGMDGDFNIRWWDNVDALLNQRCCRIIDKPGLHRRFLYYTLPFLLDIIHKLTYSTTVKHLSTNDILNSYLVYPSEDAQNSIVNYLDHKCSLIDSIIEKQKVVIEKLRLYKRSIITEAVTKGLNPNVKMKPSGIESIGDIPMNWDVISLGYEVYVRARLGWKGLKADEYVDDGYVFLATPNIKDNNIDFNNVNYISKQRYEESPEIMLTEGDVLLTKDGSTLGTVNVVRYLPREATVNSSIAVLTPSSRINGIYLYYLIKSDYIQTVIQTKKDGMGVPHLFQKDIKKFTILVPPILEQQSIADYLDRKCNKIDDIISIKQTLIDKLSKYKKSLIYECVTGKREVV